MADSVVDMKRSIDNIIDTITTEGFTRVEGSTPTFSVPGSDTLLKVVPTGISTCVMLVDPNKGRHTDEVIHDNDIHDLAHLRVQLDLLDDMNPHVVYLSTRGFRRFGTGGFLHESDKLSVQLSGTADDSDMRHVLVRNHENTVIADDDMDVESLCEMLDPIIYAKQRERAHRTLYRMGFMPTDTEPTAWVNDDVSVELSGIVGDMVFGRITTPRGYQDFSTTGSESFRLRLDAALGHDEFVTALTSRNFTVSDDGTFKRDNISVVLSNRNPQEQLMRSVHITMRHGFNPEGIDMLVTASTMARVLDALTV